LLNKSSSLVPSLGVPKFIIIGDVMLVTIYCATRMYSKPTSEEAFLNKRPSMAVHLGVTKFITIIC